MEYVLTSSEMKGCDRAAIEKYGIGAPVLMERAALRTVSAIISRYGRDIRVGVVAGSGNNGGDGIAVARILLEEGIPAQICMVGDTAHLSPETAAQLETARRLGIPIHQDMAVTSCDVIVDALFGIGLAREITGKYRDAVEAVNASGARVVSVDIPSGVDADSGQIMGCAVRADMTVTFAYRKPGLLLYPGAACAGSVVCAPIGIPDAAMDSRGAGMFTYTDPRTDLRLPVRDPSGNKGTFGKVLLIAGSRGMGGACLLAALSAFRAGAGMVRIFTASDNREALLKNIPEAIIDMYHDDGQAHLAQDEGAALMAGFEWADVVAVGPGLSMSEKARLIVEKTVACCGKPLVADADALNILAQDSALLEHFAFGSESGGYGNEVVFTPHIGEFSRLAGCTAETVKKDIIACCRRFVEHYDVSLVCKDARTVVAKKGCPVYLNTSGNSGMATAGSGDVLTGVTAGLLAQQKSGYDAAVMGTYVHGLAGDIAKGRASAYYIMAQDIIAALKDIEDIKDSGNRQAGEHL